MIWLSQQTLSSCLQGNVWRIEGRFNNQIMEVRRLKEKHHGSPFFFLIPFRLMFFLFAVLDLIKKKLSFLSYSGGHLARRSKIPQNTMTSLFQDDLHVGTADHVSHYNSKFKVLLLNVSTNRFKGL